MSSTSPLLTPRKRMPASRVFVIVLVCGFVLFVVALNLAPASGQDRRASPPLASSLFEAADRGDLQAQIRLAKAYAIGDDSSDNSELARQAIVDGVHADMVKALYWWTKAAEQGDVGAQRAAATYYGFGMAGPKDYAKSVYWARKAAEKGDAACQELLDSYRVIVESDPAGSHSVEERQSIKSALER